jgi:poly(ADP-ribose) glycohydrolase ARH3
LRSIAQDHIEGCLLGTVLADASGALFEGVLREDLHQQFNSPQAVLDHSWTRKLQDTDDGEMSLALAEYLSTHDSIEAESLMSVFVEKYQSWRGYGRGTRTLIDAYRYGTDWNFLAETVFPGGSLGNGAAMRRAIVGLRFFGDADMIWQQAANSASPTHRHQLGIEGAQLIALTTLLAVELADISPAILAAALKPRCKTTVFANRLNALAVINQPADIAALGNGIETHESVVASIACFGLFPNDYQAAIGHSIWQGGDTDTIAAMNGAVCGARLGRRGIPEPPLANLEDSDLADQISDLAKRLWDKCQSE